MCGIFGLIDSKSFRIGGKAITTLVANSEQRGRDSSGFLFFDDFKAYQVEKTDLCISKLHKHFKNRETKLILGHSRLVTNGMSDNQPVIYNDSVVFHNGIIVNADALWSSIEQKRS